MQMAWMVLPRPMSSARSKRPFLEIAKLGKTERERSQEMSYYLATKMSKSHDQASDVDHLEAIRVLLQTWILSLSLHTSEQLPQISQAWELLNKVVQLSS